MAVTTILRIGNRERVSFGSYVVKWGENAVVDLIEGTDRLSYLMNFGYRADDSNSIKFEELTDEKVGITFYISNKAKKVVYQPMVVGFFSGRTLELDVTIENKDHIFDVSYSFWLKDRQDG